MTFSMGLVIAVVPAFVASLALASLLARYRRLLDQPGHRSLHDVAVPRTGGLAIASGIAVGVVGLVTTANALPDVQMLAALGAGWMLVLMVSFLDDIGHVPAPVRLIVHFLSVGLFLALADLKPEFDTVLIAVALVWSLNLFNFMDGMDGLAGTMAIIGGGTLALLGWLAGDPAYALLAATITGAAAGFLPLNLPRARIFMGDVGSAGLGFLLGTLACWGTLRDLFPLESALLIFMPFILDASVTLFLRMLRRARIWEAHREHAYQRMVLSGWPVSRVLGVESVIMVTCSISAVGAFYSSVPHLWLTVIVVVLAGMYRHAWSRGRRADKSESGD